MLASLALAGPLVHHWGGGFFPFFPLFFLIPIFWIVVIALIVGLGRRRWRRQWAMNGGHPMSGQWGQWGGAARGAEATLAERFANGDIDEKEYRARLEVLRANK